MKKYTIGIDFGTLSARAVALELKTGREVAQAVFEYPMGSWIPACPAAKNCHPSLPFSIPEITWMR